jgi:hypothetical protein
LRDKQSEFFRNLLPRALMRTKARMDLPSALELVKNRVSEEAVTDVFTAFGALTTSIVLSSLITNRTIDEMP